MPQLSNRFWIAMTVLGGVLIATIIGISVHSSVGDDTKQLKLLHVVVRHGRRTPVTTYPNDPYLNETFFPYGWGQLTNQGKLEVYNLGKFLRKRYDKFLGKIYKPVEFYTQATDVDRTKATVQLINAGLWPPEPLQQWGALKWQPIPVHMEPLATDTLLLVRKQCPQYYIELERVMQLEEIKKQLDDHSALFDELSAITGLKIKNFDDVQDVYNTLLAQENFNLTLPAWTKDYHPHRLLQPAIFSYTVNAYTTKLKRLKGGLLLKKLITDWKSLAEGILTPPERKAFLYGGHDSTITNLLSTLNVWQPQFPHYAITVLFELSIDTITNQYGVEIYLRNSTKQEPYLLAIPGCEKFCPLHKLIDLTHDVVPNNWDEECEAKNNENYAIPPSVGP